MDGLDFVVKIKRADGWMEAELDGWIYVIMGFNN
jgi:hypothetical protein